MTFRFSTLSAVAANPFRLSHRKPRLVSLSRYRNLSTTQKVPMRVVPVPVRSDNYAYLLIDEATKQAAAVDPFDVPKVRAQAEKEGVKLTALITTHHHADHSGGNEEFVGDLILHLGCTTLILFHMRKRSVYPNVPVYGGSDQVPALTNLVKDEDTFSVGENIQVKCLATPCPPRTRFVTTSKTNPDPKKEAFLLGAYHRQSGDTLFIAGCGRFFEGTAAEMHKALSYLGSLPGETVVYNGHEYTKASLAFGAHVDPSNPAMNRLRKITEEQITTGRTTIADEKEWNVFMRLGSEAVRSTTKVDDDIEAMAKLREMKNSFRG
ncbi:Cytoplasmic glyoxalase II [Ceratobasidium sp. 428]|nr:Cytoplasmic glyoxalase II [Ceratobasidium sp. 428]